MRALYLIRCYIGGDHCLPPEPKPGQRACCLHCGRAFVWDWEDELWLPARVYQSPGERLLDALALVVTLSIWALVIMAVLYLLWQACSWGTVR